MKNKRGRPAKKRNLIHIDIPSSSVSKINRHRRKTIMLKKRNPGEIFNAYSTECVNLHSIDTPTNLRDESFESSNIFDTQATVAQETSNEASFVEQLRRKRKKSPNSDLQSAIDSTKRVYAQQRREARRLAVAEDRKQRNMAHTEEQNPPNRGKKKKVAAQDKYSVEHSYYGSPEYECQYCSSVFWAGERVKKESVRNHPVHSLCCMKGKIELPPQKEAPEPLKSLLQTLASQDSQKFMNNIRVYNSMFAMTSMGAKVDNSVNGNGSVYTYRISGENYHRIGTLLPAEGKSGSFLQLYVHDTHNETSNRIKAVNQNEKNCEIDETIVERIRQMLDAHNELVKVFRRVRDWFTENQRHDFSLRLIRKRAHRNKVYDLPTSSEVAMLIVGDMVNSNGERDILIQSTDGALKRINDLHPLYMALQYPLLFPYGNDGFHTEIPYRRNTGSRKTKRQYVTAREYYSYIFQHRRKEGKVIQSSGRLFQQFVVDCYTQIEQQRLRFLKKNQGNLRTDLYRNVYDAIQNGDADSTKVGMRTILPSSFTGSPRYMMQNYQDAMAICRAYGNPDFFITFTANPNWQEIKDVLSEMPGQKSENRPDIESRVFKMKLDEMIHDIVDNEIFGRVDAVLYTIEFQKRGLPHAHIIFWVDETSKLHSTEQVDSLIAAEIPDPVRDPIGHEAVKQFMMHGPCGHANPSSPCMFEGGCTKRFPKSFRSSTTIDENGYCVYRRRDSGISVDKNGIKLDNRFVTPFNRYLLVKYQSHINVEACNKSKAIKYLFKYVTKGPDRATAVIEATSAAASASAGIGVEDNDEIKKFLDCRYISACEGIWRIYEFPIHYRRPSVERLSYHLENEQNLVFNDNESLPAVMARDKSAKTMFTEWLELNKEDDYARTLTYVDIPTKYVWNSSTFSWKRRKSGKTIGRLTFAHPNSGERYYLRLLLNVVNGPKCYDDIKTVGEVVYPTMKMACYARGLLEDDGEWNEAINEAFGWASGTKMRELFLTILIFCDVSDVKKFWEVNWKKISDDVLIKQRRVLRNPQLQLSDFQVQNLTLAELQQLLLKNGRSLAEIQGMPQPDPTLLAQLRNSLLLEEQNYDVQLLREEHDMLKSSLNHEQLFVYNKVIDAINQSKSKLFFLYGFGGTGKTYLYKAIINKLRSTSKIVLAVASSGIAALLLPGGRTAHSRFRIPLNVTEDSTCTIKQGTQLAELIQRSSLIIWDEAPMDAKHAFEAVDRTLRDILRGSAEYDKDKAFGGKTFLMGGDFRQILPVIPGGSRGDIVNASLNSSYIWDECEVFSLSKNMRLQQLHQNTSNAHLTLEQFSKWILRIGDGKETARRRGESDEAEWVKIPEELLLHEDGDPIQVIFDSTYPEFIENQFLESYLTKRAILTPRNDVVEEINNFIMKMVNSEEKEYLSYDAIDRTNDDIGQQLLLYPVEFLNSLNPPGLPRHNLHLKIGVPVMLIRNVNPSKGLCNGTRLIVTQLGKRVIEGRIISGSHIGDKVLIPRIMLTSSDGNLPFTLKRRQFPVRVCYAMTINKSQGQTMESVGLYLPSPVFSHGQLYVALSRVKDPAGLKILPLENDEEFKGWTKNVVYREIFNSLGS